MTLEKGGLSIISAVHHKNVKQIYFCHLMNIYTIVVIAVYYFFVLKIALYKSLVWAIWKYRTFNH